MPVTDPEISFNVNDRGGEYYEKLQNLAAAISAVIGAHNSLESDALSEDDLSPVGQNLVAIPTPGGPRFIRVNSDGTISILTATEFLAAIGASSGMANPLTAPGSLIIGGEGGAPLELPKGGGAGALFALNGAENPSWIAPSSNAFDFGRWSRARGPVRNMSTVATFNIDVDGGADGMQLGASHWLDSATNLGTHPTWVGNTTTFYRLDDYLVVNSTTPERGTRYQIATPFLGSSGARDAAYQQIRYKTHSMDASSLTWSAWKRLTWDEAPINGKPHVRKNGAWAESSGGGISTAAVQTFTSANEVSNNITVTCDCTTHNHHPLDFNGSPLPSTAGSYIINLTNLPTSTTELVVGHIATRRLGRKSTVTIQAAGFTVAWLAPPSFQSDATRIDYIQYKIDPLTPTVLRLSHVYSRSS